jgi:cytochrome P450
MLLRYGQNPDPVVPIRLGRWTLNLVTGPAEVGQVLNRHVQHYHKGPGMDRENPLIGSGLLLSETPRWETSRRILKEEFLPTAVWEKQSRMRQIIGNSLDQWHDGMINVAEQLVSLTAQVAIRTLFDFSPENRATMAVIDASQELMMFFYRRSRSFFRPHYSMPWPMNRKYWSAAKPLTGFAERIYANRTTASAKLPALLEQLPSDERLAQIVTLLIAGHETTANALSWTLYLLARHPEAQNFARTDPEWLDAVIKESLRLYPPVWLLSRVALKPVSLGSYSLPKDAPILLSPWVNHRLERYWEQPETFLPERWIKRAPLSPFLYFPFGAGQRSCIGETFAQQEMVITLDLILSRWTLEPASAEEVLPLPLLSLKPKNGVWIRLAPRSGALG